MPVWGQLVKEVFCEGLPGQYLAVTMTYSQMQKAQAWWHVVKKLNDVISTQVAIG